ncbi:MAG: lon [Verrucomicrobiales bacterium]|nr:lon [Verrucomicrobiales bacterium]MDB6129177.1 lon [Verrucomicrobiales bacterium]
MTTPDTEFIKILGSSSEQQDQLSTRTPPKTLPEVLPILGLSDIVVFPGMIAPLLVETTESIRLIDDVVSGDRFLVLVLQKSPEIENPIPTDLYGVGCAARVLKMLKFPDNTVRVLIEGLRRVRIKEFSAQVPYLQAKIEILGDELDNSVELTAFTRNAERQFQEIIRLSPTLSEQVKIAALNTEDPSKLADLIAANLNLNLNERQALLETTSVKERLSKLLPLLNKEMEVLNLGTKIQSEVASSMSKSQREFFLREQIRAIQRELGEADPVSTEVNVFRELIDKNPLSPEAKLVAYKELDRLQQMPTAVPEFTITRNYLDWLTHLPWNKYTEDKIELEHASQLLDAEHYGLAKVKDRLLDFLAVIKLKKQLKGPILCLVGPPGVGKTSLGKSVAEALGRKFARISLGGMRDEAEIRGHRRTYVGAMPGRIIQTLRRTESANPVILLDEIDKIGADYKGDPASALLEVLDPAQNNSFSDHYLEVPFDLSRVLFITTANWLDPINAALRDRLEVIEIPSYTALEKLQIARRHLVPKQLEEHGMKKKLVKFPDSTLKRIIEEYTREAGVRQLEREIGSVTRKAVRRFFTAKNFNTPLTVEASKLSEFLGPPKFRPEAAERIKEIGIAVGLAWTPVGGEILFIEATRMRGKGGLILTGSLGDVMKESAQTALSYLKSQAVSLKLDVEDFDKWDIHVHVPAGATPKDGPSAGVTIFSALASLLTKRLVKSDLAMTGEISLRGRVLRVGGIKEKVLAAARSGMKQVILPKECDNDWLEVPEEIRHKLKVHFVQHVSELLPLALKPA